MHAKPFIHKFRSYLGAAYIYDVNSNEMIEVDDTVHDIIEAVLSKNDDSVNKWRLKYGEDRIRRAHEEILHARDQGYFLPRRAVSMVKPACEGCMDDLMAGEECKLILNLTEDCNLRCVYCAFSGSYRYNRTHSNRVLPEDCAERAIRRALELGRASSRASISFYGGEPFLHFDRLVRLIEYAKRIGGRMEELNFHVDTNGTLLSSDMRDYLRRNKIYVQVSLDGPKEIHDRYRVFRGGSGTFDTIMKNLDALRSEDEDYYRYYVGFAATVSPPYRLPEVAEYFEGDLFTTNVVMITFVDPYDTTFLETYGSEEERSALGEQLDMLRSDYMKARIRGEIPAKFTRTLFDPSMVRIHKRGRTPLEGVFPPNGICVPGVRRFFVDTAGDVFPCERVGNAFKLGSVDAGVESSRVFDLIDEYRERSQPDCSSCWAMRLCGLCFASSRRGCEFDIERKRENCVIERNRIDQALRTYVTILDTNEHGLDFINDMIVR